MASWPLEITATISTASNADLEAATQLIYMLPENICEVSWLNRERKEQVYPFR